MTGGKLDEADLTSIISFEPHIANRYPDIFKHGDQGALNTLFRTINFHNECAFDTITIGKKSVTRGLSAPGVSEGLPGEGAPGPSRSKFP